MVYDRGGFAARRYLAVELGGPGDHECRGWPGTGDPEAMRVIPRHEDEAARPGGPAILTAISGEFAREKIKHLDRKSVV